MKVCRKALSHQTVQLCLTGILLGGLVTACATPAPIQQVADQGVREIPIGEEAKPLRFQRIVVRMPRNSIIGAVQTSLLCISRSELTYRGGRATIEDETYSDIFREELEAANYTVVGDPDALFDDPDAMRAELVIAGLIKDIKANICFPRPDGRGGYTEHSNGEASMEVEWQVFSQLNRQVVYEVTTDGAGSTSFPRIGGGEAAIVEAFAQATRNLLADDGFYDLVTGKTAVTTRGYQVPDSETAIAEVPLRQTLFRDTVTETRAKVVTIFAGDGVGSGFFIADNLVMTNQHVVGGANLVVIRTVTGREIVGEVIATNAGRDVALVQTESLGSEGLPINSKDYPVGSPVFVIGSPLGKEYESTVSAGIISAYRTEDGLRYIQSDVNIVGGNSGGPMLDDNSNVIGITVQGLAINNVPVGINRFIPIGDALDALNVRIQGDQS